jgi:hypothetical protein
VIQGFSTKPRSRLGLTARQNKWLSELQNSFEANQPSVALFLKGTYLILAKAFGVVFCSSAEKSWTPGFAYSCLFIKVIAVVFTAGQSGLHHKDRLLPRIEILALLESCIPKMIHKGVFGCVG